MYDFGSWPEETVLTMQERSDTRRDWNKIRIKQHFCQQEEIMLPVIPMCQEKNGSSRVTQKFIQSRKPSDNDGAEEMPWIREHAISWHDKKPRLPP